MSDPRPAPPDAIAGTRLARGEGKLLVVCLDNLGDLVFASALLPPLRERFPGARITLWCKSYTAEIAPLVPGVDAVVASDPFWDRSPGRGKGPLLPFLGAARALRRERFDAALLAFAPWRTAAAVSTLGIPVRIGRERHRNRPFLTHALPPEDKKRPVLAELARLLEPLGIPPRPLRYRLERAPLEARRTRLAPLLGDCPVALHPFASKRGRCVDIREWITVARALASRGASPLWIGSAAELSELRAAPGAGEEWRYADRLLAGSLADLAAALSLATLFVGHDSGPLHIAGALGVPCVGVFAPGEPLRTFPQGVGPARMLARPSPEGITAGDILAEVDALR
ncbi:MAG TPA: glycosyltransferase family 9 protein [Gemmatimonadaceae bacterium]|nr:glycosyltransferase family 9 protein [Gemmatimonadaceae bacterium]